MNTKTISLLTAITLGLATAVVAQPTETYYLTGKGLGDTQTWEFYCTAGMNSNKWKTIQVPSQWELQGFGEYSYGRWYMDKSIKNPPKEEGIYRRSFEVPERWKGRRIFIVFEGVMTDTEVFINGQSAGNTHQGGFNQFSYEIGDKLKIEKKNRIEVRVRKESTNKSINGAERKADWWIFGGIYRPVYLEAKPIVHIQRVATHAAANGMLHTELHTTPLPQGYAVETTITQIGGNNKNELQKQITPLQAGEQIHTSNTQWTNIKTWDVENPNRYSVEWRLLDPTGKPIHIHKENLGFRTVEFRPQDGIYVNNTKVILKGINRHSFHPDGGRTTNKEISIGDALLIKEMNMNAVRFHYAPDKHFLEACDSLGIFVINELAGWQNAYDSTVGEQLLKEFIIRDVNHPSIILWSSGNEGGWNNSLNDKFALFDPQKRHVIHPWADFNGLDTHHYPAFLTGIGRFTNGYKVFMPTEFMHGMYDQGHGAGLEDFWQRYTSHPLFAGGFMWDFSDNAVKRVDRGGVLDSDGSNGTDGILGPYREKEGSYYTVREVWSPIQFQKINITQSFKGKFLIRNNYLFSNLNECSMKYRLLAVRSPLSGEMMKEIKSGTIQIPPLNPYEQGFINLQIDSIEKIFQGDLLEIKAWDKHGKEICTWTWPIGYASGYTQREIASSPSATNKKASLSTDSTTVCLMASDVSVTLDRTNGILQSVINANGKVSFNNGPIPIGMKAKFVKSNSFTKNGNAYFVAHYLGAIDSIVWQMSPTGLLSMNAVLLNRASGGKGFDDAMMEENITNFGFSFSYPEENVKGIKWYGRGPYRVWKNRIPGNNYGIWEKEYNDTSTGDSFETLVYPEFKGYHANMLWGKLLTKESPLTFYTQTDGLFLRLYTPKDPKKNISKITAYPQFPEGDISFLLEIPAIRCFKPVSQHGPQSQPGMIRIKKGDEGLSLNLWFDFRTYPRPVGDH